MKLIPNKESEYGKFDLVPDEGQKLSHFIDYESKLLVVSESPIDTSHLPKQFGFISYMPKTFIIDSKQQKILNFKEWKEYFYYEPIETFSEDKKLKEIWIRKHEEGRDTDSYEGYLIEVETGKKLIDKAMSVAFHDSKRRSLIDHYYKSIEHKKQYLKSLEKGEYPIDFYREYWSSLNDDEVIFQFTKGDAIYQLKYNREGVSLYEGEIPLQYEDYKTLDLKKEIKKYQLIDEFWNQFSLDNTWFQEVKTSKINRVMEKFIVTSHNQILERGEISYKEHEQLHSWVNRCFNKKIERNVYWQFCANCRERVFYFPRYPKHACKKCVQLITDELGNKLNYKEIHELLGSKMRLKSNQQEVKIFIGKDEYWASEARFGGTVYQKKEKN